MGILLVHVPWASHWRQLNGEAPVCSPTASLPTLLVLRKLQSKSQQLTDPTESLMFREKSSLSVNSDLKGWIGSCKGNIETHNAKGMDKSGSSSPAIDPFKLIVKSCREDTGSSCPVLHNHRWSCTRPVVKKFTHCSPASHHLVHHKLQGALYKMRTEATKITWCYRKAGKDLASPLF